MSETAAAALTREIAGAGKSLVRLIRYDPDWPLGMDFSSRGFVRSFFAPLLALPFTLVFAAIVLTTGGAQPVTPAILWAAALSHVFNVAGYTILVGLMARPLGFAAGYGAFIILVNWATLFLTLALCVLAGLSFVGEPGIVVQRVLWFALFMLSLFITWRAGRETLSADVGPPLMMVVLSVAVGMGSDQAATLIVKTLS